ncbi:glucose-6-phosphate isomerase [Oceanospirillum beijerinckii]|uniref:glucose-6-phosphate isomerase n=1 Tax=Oceanospirillum beijerinckii TaxID=64976 RepID=UPI000A037A4B|nr:glucose-6-phosphate isomerase [Oceanospirillum beijerinckii]
MKNKNVADLDYCKLSLRNEYAALMEKADSCLSLSELFARDPERGERLRCQAAGLTLDYSKQSITDEVFEELLKLADSCQLPRHINKLFGGDIVNLSEDKAALHTALRTPAEVLPDELGMISAELDKLAQLVFKIQQGVWRGFSGKRITDVVNLGVGGSDLGPLMVSHALDEYRDEGGKNLKVHFASSMDGSQLFQLMEHLAPESTLFIVSSKSFTTIDTLSNAQTVRDWLGHYCSDEAMLLRCHFIGVSANRNRMTQWGIHSENQLEFWSWVGGRFSLWSAIGLPIALSVGVFAFRRLLAGAFQMDLHFRSAPLAENLPVIMALLGVWNVSFRDIRAHAILPYDGRLKFFPSYLEQLEMESNGKSVTQLGEPVDYMTCPVLWGEVGTNAQHAFYQLLHQGTQPVVSDFIIAASRYDGPVQQPHQDALLKQHDLNISNCLAQSRVLAFGAGEQPGLLNSFRHYPGNQPSSTLVLNRLEPESMGALIAAYEHKVFCQAVIWGINPFDQWGVEQGKEVAVKLQSILQPGYDGSEPVDSSTQALAALIRQQRNKK